MIIFSLLRIVAIFLFLYLSWRKMRHDYAQEDLLTYSWLFLLAFLASGRLIYGLVNWGIWNDSIWDWLSVFTKRGFNYFGGYIGAIVFSYFFAKSRSWKMWNFAEDLTPVFMVFMLTLLLGELAVSLSNIGLFLWLNLLIATFVLTNILSKKYRSYTWYKSGKKGFGFLLANIIFGWGGALVVWQQTDNWWLVGLMGVWGLISITGLVILGEIVQGVKFLKR